jgi:DNA-binding CsgD family transcriptional regulator
MQTGASIRPLPAASSLVTTRDAAARVKAVHRGVRRLGELESLSRVVAAAPSEACRSVGVDRSLLSHLHDGVLQFAGASYDDDPQMAADFVRLARTVQPSLSDCGPERRAASGQEAVLVRGAQEAADVFDVLVSMSQTGAYVVAPIVVDGMTVGLLHGDRVASGREVDEFDAELLGVFSDGLATRMSTFLAGVRRPGVGAAGTAGADSGAGSDPGPLRTLTERERQILVLLAEGASNAQIADRLVIGEATVKTHVGHILRKLEASNRTEAVSRYHAFATRGAGAVATIAAMLPAL